jgi:hypothetical protein
MKRINQGDLIEAAEAVAQITGQSHIFIVVGGTQGTDTPSSFCYKANENRGHLLCYGCWCSTFSQGCLRCCVNVVIGFSSTWQTVLNQRTFMSNETTPPRRFGWILSNSALFKDFGSTNATRFCGLLTPT